MPYYQKTIISSRVIEIERYFSTDGGAPKGKPKMNQSPDDVKKVNERNARKKLIRLFSANFTDGDLFVTKTYDNVYLPEDDDRVLKNHRNFIKRLKRARKKMGLPELKYIAVIERGEDGRLHHHLIINKMDMGTVAGLWGMGRVTISPLHADSDGQYKELAQYFLKETTFQEDEAEAPGRSWVMGKRWCASKNLAKPEVERKEIKRFNPLRAPQEVISINRGVGPYKDCRVIEYSSGSSDYGVYQYVRLLRHQTSAQKDKKKKRALPDASR